MEILAVRLAQGEAEAFWELYCTFGPRLVGFFRRRGVPDTDAENLAFECLQDVRRKIGKYQRREGGSFMSWIYTMARRKWIDWWRRNGITHPLEDEMLKNLTGYETQLFGLLIELEEDSESPAMTTRAVYDALEQLSTTDQEVVRLRFIDAHLDNAQLAAHLEIQINAVKTRLSRALKRLKAILEKDPRIKLRK
jgi:RNA polymerase sigma-70 factor (ECF subfamily)